jgi:di/tricarboxylate transporter
MAVGGSFIVGSLIAIAALLIVTVLDRTVNAPEDLTSLPSISLVVIAASFGLGKAIEASGLAASLGHLIIEGSSGFGPIGVLLAVTLATIALTELITNNAAAVLLFPIAIATAAQLGLDPRPFAIAVTVAASASFLTPIGYQTNTMVYGIGGYRFTDYIRLGLPLTILVIIVIVTVVPVFWPLTIP